MSGLAGYGMLLQGAGTGADIFGNILQMGANEDQRRIVNARFDESRGIYDAGDAANAGRVHDAFTTNNTNNWRMLTGGADDPMGVLSEYGRNRDAISGRGEQAINLYGQDQQAQQYFLHNRTGTALGMLNGYGDQTRRNINSRFDANAGTMTANLARRGLGGTTLGSSLGLGNERERARAVGDLDESLRGQATSLYSSLSGDEGTALGNRAGTLANLRTGLNSDMAGADSTYAGIKGTLANQFGQGQLTGLLGEVSDRDMRDNRRVSLLSNGPSTPQDFTGLSNIGSSLNQFGSGLSSVAAAEAARRAQAKAASPWNNIGPAAVLGAATGGVSLAFPGGGLYGGTGGAGTGGGGYGSQSFSQQYQPSGGFSFHY